jgi:hypothetical protein
MFNVVRYVTTGAMITAARAVRIAAMVVRFGIQSNKLKGRQLEPTC